MMGLAAISTPLVTLLLTEKWLPCVPFLQIYCFSYAIHPVHLCNVQAINAIGRSDVYLKLEFIKKSYGIMLLVGSVLLFDSPLAIAISGLISTCISWFVNAYPNKNLVGYSYVEQVRDVVPSLLMSLIMYGVVLTVGQLPINVFVLIIVQIIVGVLVYFIISLVLKPEPFQFLVKQIMILHICYKKKIIILL